MKDLIKKLDDLKKPSVKNTFHQHKLKQALLSSRYFKKSTFSLTAFFGSKLSKVMAALLLIIFVGVAGTVSVASAADSSKPGDFLFGLDKFFEQVQIFLTANPQAKLNLKIAIAKERLTELDELSHQLESEEEEQNSDNQNNNGTATTTDQTATTTPTTTATSTATTTDSTATSTATTTNQSGQGQTSNSSLQEAINQALAEVENAIAKVKDDSAKLTLKAGSAQNLTTEQVENFLSQVTTLTQRQDILIKELKFKAYKKKIELKIKTVDQDKEGDSENEIKTEEDEEEKYEHASSTPEIKKDHKDDDDSDDEHDDEDENHDHDEQDDD